MQKIRLSFKILLIGVLFAAAFILAANFSLAEEEWRELKGEHFLVYFTADEKFARDVLDKAEKYYNNIASDLGYPRYKEFWLWEKRCKIYIYPDHKSFLKSSNQPEWSQGMAEYKSRKILSYVWSKGFLESLLPHEIAHLIFRDFVGFRGEVPLWLDEGVAQWAELPKRKDMKAKAKQLYENDGFLTISDMMKIDVRTLPKENRVYVRSALTRDGSPGAVFLSTVHLVNTYYLQSVSLVGFMIERYGGKPFADFCRELRDGKSLEGALKSAYPNSMSDIKGFEGKWKEYLSEQ